MTIKSLMSLISPIPLIIIHGNEALVPRLAAAPRDGARSVPRHGAAHCSSARTRAHSNYPPKKTMSMTGVTYNSIVRAM